MKFPLDKCVDCGLDLTTAEPAEVTYPGEGMAVGTCPDCHRTYFMVEVIPQPLPELVPGPVSKSGRRRASRSTTEPVSEHRSEPETEPLPSAPEE